MYVYNSQVRQPVILLDRLCPLRVSFAQICYLSRVASVGIPAGGCLGLPIMGYVEQTRRKRTD